eukprot:1106936-Pleurochrysis_carterae.AAC.1
MARRGSCCGSLTTTMSCLTLEKAHGSWIPAEGAQLLLQVFQLYAAELGHVRQRSGIHPPG